MRIRNFDELYDEFRFWKNEVNHVNRYFDDTPLLADIRSSGDLIECIIPKGSCFYRGRIYNLDEEITEKGGYETWLKSEDACFQGYGEIDSGAPPANYTKEGRLNGVGISFLYTSNDSDTVIYELRPTREEIVSVAKFITRKDLRFADLTQERSEGIHIRKLSDLIGLIAYEFAIPQYAGHNYAFTQYLAGQFMNMGFMGVVFDSSLNPQGKNYVFFNPNDCEAISSHLHKVFDINISSHPITRKEV